MNLKYYKWFITKEKQGGGLIEEEWHHDMSSSIISRLNQVSLTLVQQNLLTASVSPVLVLCWLQCDHHHCWCCLSQLCVSDTGDRDSDQTWTVEMCKLFAIISFARLHYSINSSIYMSSEQNRKLQEINWMEMFTSCSSCCTSVCTWLLVSASWDLTFSSSDKSHHSHSMLTGSSNLDIWFKTIFLLWCCIQWLMKNFSIYLIPDILSLASAL